jgi:hypothetical protein
LVFTFEVRFIRFLTKPFSSSRVFPFLRKLHQLAFPYRSKLGSLSFSIPENSAQTQDYSQILGEIGPRSALLPS